MRDIPFLKRPDYDEQAAQQFIKQVRLFAEELPGSVPSRRDTEWILRVTDPQSQLRILHILGAPFSTPPKAYGGAEIIGRDLITEQRKQGHEVLLYAPATSTLSGVIPTISQAVLEAEGGRWEHQGRFNLHYDAILRHLRHEVESNGPGQPLPYDFVIAHLTDPYSTRIAEILGFLNHFGVPSLVIKHSPLNLNDRFFEKGKEQIIDRADPTYFQWYWRNLPLVTFGPVDKQVTLQQFPGAWIVDEIPLALSDRSFLPQRPRLNAVGTVGRIEPVKGQADAIRLAKAVGLNILVAGPIFDRVYYEQQVKPQIDIDLSGSPQEMAALLNSTDSPLLRGDQPQAIYLGPISERKEADEEESTKNNFFSRILVFLSPIHWEEPGGTVHVEALAAGTPLVAYKRGCVEGQIAPHRGQWGFDPEENDERAFKEAILASLNLNHAQIQQWAYQEIHMRNAAERYDALMRFLAALWWANDGWKI